MSPPERMLWLCLKLKQVGGLSFRKQVPMGDYIADFYCHAARLVVEVDGSSHQGERFTHDQQRDVWMQKSGVTVLRFTASEVLNHRQGVVDRIRDVGLKRAEELDQQRTGR